MEAADRSLSHVRRVLSFADDAILGEQQNTTFYCCCNVAAILKSMTTLPGSTLSTYPPPKFEFCCHNTNVVGGMTHSQMFSYLLTRATYVFFGNMFYLYSSSAS